MRYVGRQSREIHLCRRSPFIFIRSIWLDSKDFSIRWSNAIVARLITANYATHPRRIHSSRVTVCAAFLDPSIFSLGRRIESSRKVIVKVCLGRHEYGWARALPEKSNSRGEPLEIIPSRKATAIYREGPALTSKRKRILAFALITLLVIYMCSRYVDRFPRTKTRRIT